MKEIPLSELEAYFGIKLDSVFCEINDYTQSQILDQEIDETS